MLDIYFRQPIVLDEESGLRDAGALLANFGNTTASLMDIVSGDFNPQGRLPFTPGGASSPADSEDSAQRDVIDHE